MWFQLITADPLFRAMGATADVEIFNNLSKSKFDHYVKTSKLVLSKVDDLEQVDSDKICFEKLIKQIPNVQFKTVLLDIFNGFFNNKREKIKRDE